ncbi:hypothetical protein M9H77_22824 [Catharanthus roseus]|uniref:Uncharacterized protein n=1 Tax=Catharanthus roseus TaxID=4058 RepID=A0ACC0AS94_CATRO|nr:hypothetical protein M9H77_22824 [Catharanthus roseus]
MGHSLEECRKRQQMKDQPIKKQSAASSMQDGRNKMAAEKVILRQSRSSKVIGRQTWLWPLIQTWFKILIQEGSKVLIQVRVYSSEVILVPTGVVTKSGQHDGKGVGKRITPIPIENKVGNGQPIDKRKRPVGKTEVAANGRRRETKLEEGKLFDIVTCKFNDWKVSHNFHLDEAGRIVLLWDPSRSHMDVMDMNSQAIHSCITCKVSLWKFFVSFVYGLHSVVSRRPLWQSLVQFGSTLKQPWLVLGDFNNILNGNERRGQSSVSSYEVRDFMKCCVDLGLVDINSRGFYFTWTNNNTWSKIDRAMCNQEWLAEGFNTVANFLPSVCFLDHSPCVVGLFETNRQTKQRFMLFKMWSDHGRFLSPVEWYWSMDIQGTKQFAMCRKLKLLKKPLKELNRKHFAHI